MPSNKKSIAYTKDKLPIPKNAKQYLDFDAEGEEVWTVEDIVREKKDYNGDKLYLVKWKGWAHKYSTWEPESNFINGIEQLKATIAEEKAMKKSPSSKKNCQINEFKTLPKSQKIISVYQSSWEIQLPGPILQDRLFICLDAYHFEVHA